MKEEREIEKEGRRKEKKVKEESKIQRDIYTGIEFSAKQYGQYLVPG